MSKGAEPTRDTADAEDESDMEESEAPAPFGEAGVRDVSGDIPMGTILTDSVALAQERDDYLSALQRLQADFENYRKRVARQQEEQSNRAALDLVRSLLPVLDTLDLARSHMEGDESAGGPEAQALLAARSMLIDVLGKEGLERVDDAGVAFDPSVHDAVAHIPGDDEEGTTGHHVVDEVLRAGYRWRGQVVRPAMVRVKG